MKAWWRRKHRLRNFFLALVALGAALFFVLGGVFLLWAATLTMPTVDSIEAQRQEQSTKIYDRTGTVLLYDMHQDVRRTVVSLDDMSDYIKNATISIEDAGFYQHFGIEPLAILRAVFKNLVAGDLFGGQGGSTITQQVVKNMLLVKDKTISRKLKEWVLAIKLERQLSKDEILELYLNEAPYGGTKYGIEEASQAFFGKSAKELTLAEAAYLAALPQAPTYYSPYGNNRDALEQRKKLVLSRMLELGYISQEEYDTAKNEEVTFRPRTGATIKAPHFVFYVISELAKTYGDANLAQANLSVTTTLDWDLQREAEQIVYEHALENVDKYNASNASLMAVDPNTGEILVMVGSRDYFDDKIDGNYNIGLALRQPGSSFKPFAYAAALEKGYTSETVVYDVRTQFSTGCDKTDLTSNNGCYSPGNYDNKFHGPITFREALAQSVNVPAVKVLYLTGIRNTIELARAMGISTLDSYKRYGLTLVLGGGEVSLLEMTSAYGVFAHDGFRYPHAAIREVRDGSGKLLEEHTLDGAQVVDPNVARTISDMLNDNVARTPAFGSNSYLYFPGRDVAVKTGTTNDYRDAWIIGYTPTIAAGAWAGNNDNSPMKKKVAGFIVAPLWNDFMNKYFELHPENTPFTKPEPLDPELKPVLRGYKYTTPHTAEQRVGTIPDSGGGSLVEQATTPHSILYWVNKDDPRGPLPQNPASDPQYPYWEYGILLWRLGQGDLSLSEVTGIRKDATGDVGTPHLSVAITRPSPGSTFRRTQSVEIRLTIESTEPLSKVLYYIDGHIAATKNSRLRSYSFKPYEHNLTKGDHILTVVAYDEQGARGGDSITFAVE